LSEARSLLVLRAINFRRSGTVAQEPDVDLDQQIGSCTALIQSDRESADNRAVAYNLRGNSYYGDGDNDRAITGYTDTGDYDRSPTRPKRSCSIPSTPKPIIIVDLQKEPRGTPPEEMPTWPRRSS
jgi:hypothetical protein